jgi:hypothetical protein
MADNPTVHADRLPTLTEVLELGRGSAADVQASAVFGPGSAAGRAQADPVTNPATGAETDVDPVARVLALLEPRLGALLETRLREALAPALARAADGLIRDVQAELAPTLRSLVEEAVAQALRQPRSLK